MAHRVQTAADDLDAIGVDKGTGVDGDGLPDSSPALLDSTLRADRTEAYRAVVDAAYRQHAIDPFDVKAETLEHETVIPASHIDAEDPEFYLVGLADRPKDKAQPAEPARQSPPAANDANLITQDGEDRAFGHLPASASGGDGSIGNDGGAQPPSGDSPSNPEGESPEGVNGGLGELVSVNAKDRSADSLAERIGGESSVRFANGPANEFDAISNDYVAQAKPANFTLNQAFRNQAKVTFEVALQSGRKPYFQFDGPPGPGVLDTLGRYADRYGIEPAIDLTPLGEDNA